MRVTASGRSAHEPLVLTSSGSALVAPEGFGNSIASSRNQETTSTPSSASSRWSCSCPQTSARISSGVHSAATLPVQRPRPLPLGDVERQHAADPGKVEVRGQNWRCEIDVRAHAESR